MAWSEGLGGFQEARFQILLCYFHFCLYRKWGVEFRHWTRNFSKIRRKVGVSQRLSHLLYFMRNTAWSYLIYKQNFCVFLTRAIIHTVRVCNTYINYLYVGLIWTYTHWYVIKVCCKPQKLGGKWGTEFHNLNFAA